MNEKKEMVNEELNKTIEPTKKDGGYFSIETVEKPDFIRGFLSAIMEQCIVLAISLTLLLIFDGIIRLLGFYVAERMPIFLVVYIISNIGYRTFYKSTNINIKR